MKCTQSTAIGGNMLAMEGLDTQEISEFVKGTAKSARRGETLEASHGSVSILDPAMVLLNFVVQVDVGPVSDRVAQAALRPRSHPAMRTFLIHLIAVDDTDDTINAFRTDMASFNAPV